MYRMDLNRDWALQAGEPSTLPGMPANVRTVHLPHDYMIESDVDSGAKNGVGGGCYPGSLMSYTKLLEIPASWQGQRVLVRFAGCAGLAKIVVNGHV